MATNRESIERRSAETRAEEAMQHLIELFGNVLDLEIIQSVAQGCEYNMETTSHILIEMSSSIGAVPKKPLQGKQKNDDKQLFPHLNKKYPRLKNGDDSDNDVIVVSESDKQTSSYANIMNNPRLKNCDDDDDVILMSEKNMNLPSTKPNTGWSTLPNQKKVASPQRKSKKEQESERVILHVRQGSRVLILMRGLPGSGKSFLAKEIINKSIGYPNYSDFILSTDDFFIDHRTGRYVYDRMRLASAHEWNHRRANKAMSQGISPVIIDNTNLQAWEMKPYVMMAVKFCYIVEIVEPFTHWAFNDKELARRSLHDVPKVKIKEMIERYEKNITPHKLLAMYSLAYAPTYKPPIYRSYPPVNHLQRYYNGMDNSTFVNNQSTSQKGYNKKHKANSIQVLDLMDFDSDVVQSAGYVDNKAKNSPECDLVDSILMHDTHSNNSPDILKPNVWNSPQKHTAIAHINSEPELKKARTFSVDIDTKDNMQDTSNLDGGISENSRNPRHTNKDRDLYPGLDLSSWGLSDNAISTWEAWDIVKPVNSKSEEERLHYVQNESAKASCIPCTSDSATNTSHTDFALLRNEDHGPEDVKLLTTKNRNINEGVIHPIINSSKKTLLDKSSMTNEDVLSAALSRERDASDEKQIAVLVSLFPGIPIDHLKDIYEKCGKDINWTGDILLDDKREFLPLPQTGSNDNNNNDRSSNSNNEINSMIKEESGNSSDSLQLNMEELSLAPEKSGSVENFNDKKNLSESSKEIKKHIEENVEINKDYYSKHILKIKNQRYGTNNKVIEPQPSTSKLPTFEYPTLSGEVIAVNTDVDLDNFEPDIDFPETEEEEEMMELNLGDGVISQLETQFGFSDMLPQGYLPIIHVPVSLARQLYALYVESVLVQMENQNQVLEAIAKEDEEFARKLHMQEQQMNQIEEGRRTPDLQEIMDEQAAANLYLKEIEEWKNLTPDNLAIRLTRQKLYNAFPTVQKDLLMEILYAHNNSYEQTVEVLMASTDRNKVNDPDGNIMQPPITETDVNEMKAAEEETKKNAYTPDVPKTAREYREEASQYHQKHKDLMQKAQQAYQRKQYEVAQFYSDLAKTHTRLYDQANSLAASAFLQEHSKKLENFHTIDLHYLYVKEAIAALDMFLDTNIRLLEGSNKKTENLFVITGRGKRSDQGISRIKPAVMARLRKRDIWYMEVNPGLLKVRVRPHSALTSSLH